MRAAPRVYLPLLGLIASCGGGDGGGTGPTTTHQVAGPWTYETRTLQDGHGNTCSTTGSLFTVTQSGNRANIGGTLVGGTINCTGTNPGSGSLGSGTLSSGAIRGDSIDFAVDQQTWRSVGKFITTDSLAGVVNAIYVVGGRQYILVGYWYSKRQ
jgi:hypothetical protein